MAKNQTRIVGAGKLHIGQSVEDITYEFDGDPSKLRPATSWSPGSAVLRGAIVATPEVATQAFQQGRGFIDLGDGQRCSVTFFAYCPGDSRVFVEAAAEPRFERRVGSRAAC